MPVSATDTVKALVAYLSIHVKTDADIPKARRALAALSEMTVRKLTSKLEKKKIESTKDFIREHWKANYNEDLEKRKDFIRWLDVLDNRGHQMYEVVCDHCGGTGEKAYMRKMIPAQCVRCSGTGVQVRPEYCKECQQLWPHPGYCSHLP